MKWIAGTGIFLLTILQSPLTIGQSPEDGLQSINLQLRWHHQYQFAGYYAAVEKGYYREEGLQVNLIAGSPERQPVTEVLSGRAQYAEGNSEILFHRLRGEPLVALAAIFQHSPSVLLVRKDSGIKSPHDLIGKRAMLMDGMNDPDFLTMFLNEGIPLSSVNIMPSSYQIDDLVNKRVEAFNSYLTNEPYYLGQLGIEYTVIDPRSYRVDFYSDILFTSEQELENHPQRVAAVRRASLKGWDYAMSHPEEMIDILIGKYGVKKSREHLLFEYQAMKDLMLPHLIQIGHMNPDRWEHMAQTMVRSGMIEPGYSLNGFLYNPHRPSLPTWVAPALLGAITMIVLVSFVAIRYKRLSRNLESTQASLSIVNDELAYNLAEIRELHEQLRYQALRDPLTGLYNRRYLDDTLDRELARAERDGYSLCVAIIDIDRFKDVNDSYGHQAGDQVLQTLGKLLGQHSRKSDIPCRQGGDEFCLIMPRLSPETARDRAKQWHHAFGAMRFRFHNEEVRISLSIGIACTENNTYTSDAIFMAADQALYTAKSEGRNRIRMVSDSHIEKPAPQDQELGEMSLESTND